MAQSNPPRLSVIDMVLDTQEGVTEEDYYYAEYTAQEREEGLHLAAMKFVSPEPLWAAGSTACSFMLQLSPACRWRT